MFYKKLPSNSSSMTDPFYETEKNVNIIINHLEKNLRTLSDLEFNTRITQIERYIKLLNSCALKVQETRDRHNKIEKVKTLENKINKTKTNFLTKNKIQIIIPDEQSDKLNDPGHSEHDNQKLLMDQIIGEQDRHLDLISTSLSNLNTMASSIHDEINHQNIMIDDITIKVDDTTHNMNSITKKIVKFNKTIKNGFCFRLGIILLIIILIVIIIITVIS